MVFVAIILYVERIYFRFLVEPEVGFHFRLQIWILRGPFAIKLKNQSDNSKNGVNVFILNIDSRHLGFDSFSHSSPRNILDNNFFYFLLHINELKTVEKPFGIILLNLYQKFFSMTGLTG